MNKYPTFPRPEVSFVARIDELHKENTRLSRELNEWKNRAAIESDRRRAAEHEIRQLKITIQQFQADSKKLEMHINEWKLIAEESRTKAVKYCGEVNNLFAAMEARLELP